MDPLNVMIGAFAGIAVMTLLFKPLFGTAGGFFDCIRNTVPRTTLWTFFRNEKKGDWRSNLRLQAWFVAGVLTTIIVVWVMTELYY